MLMDAITLYLPHPNERQSSFVQYYSPDLCALAFKVVYDKQRGLLTFLRVYSGKPYIIFIFVNFYYRWYHNSIYLCVLISA